MMLRNRHIPLHSKGAARLALAGMATAVVALASLAVWSAIVTQDGASGLSNAGVQTSGHLRAVQALSLVDTQTDVLEAGVNPPRLRKLRNAQRILDESLAKMKGGAVVDATVVARRASPILAQLTPEIELFLAAVRSGDKKRSVAAEQRMEATMQTLQLLLNDLASDPSELLRTRLDAVTGTELTVRRTAFVLLPLGLVFVGICAWMLRTYRRRSEAAVREALEQHESILKAADGIYGLDRDGRVTFANPAAARMTGHEVEELLGRRSHELVHHTRPDGTPYPDEECPMSASLENGVVHHSENDVYWRKDGTSFPVEFTSTPTVEGGKVTGAVVVFRDITERREIERAKDEFISVVSHELRTPLTSIRGSLGLLESGVLGPLPEKASGWSRSRSRTPIASCA